MSSVTIGITVIIVLKSEVIYPCHTLCIEIESDLYMQLRACTCIYIFLINIFIISFRPIASMHTYNECGLSISISFIHLCCFPSAQSISQSHRETFRTLLDSLYRLFTTRLVQDNDRDELRKSLDHCIKLMNKCSEFNHTHCHYVTTSPHLKACPHFTTYTNLNSLITSALHHQSGSNWFYQDHFGRCF